MNTSPEVDRWFADSAHPQKALMQAVRAIILGADPRVGECIKWKTPTFTYKGNIASINPQAKKFVSLLFHTGARIPGDHPRLEGGGETARYMKVEDAETVRGDLEAVIRAWCADKG